MVYAMLIVFFILFYTPITTASFVPNCSFLNNSYSTNAAVANQFRFINQTSLVLIAEYAFVSSSSAISTFDLGLIYPFSSSDYFVPFPILLNCASIVNSCQLKIVAGSTRSSTARDSEPITVPLTQFNYTSTSIPSNQMGLYLIQGQYQFSNCSLNNGQDLTDNQTIFNIQIIYEKSLGTSCIPSIDTCGSSLLTNCSSSSLTCTCLSSSSPVPYSNAFYCADTLNTSNCTIFPERCVSWCNFTTNDLCICPSDTLKIQRNNFYVCELPVDASNCTLNDSIRRCSYGQTCVNGQCVNEVLTTTTIVTTTTATNQPENSNNQSLRIALGVIAGLLGTSVLVLLGVFCWLRQRQKRLRRNAEKSLSPASSSSGTSSLYISPVQQQQPRKYSVYHLPTENSTPRFSSFYRSDSFRQAVLSGHQRHTEYVSTRRDSFSSPKDDLDYRAYSTIEFPILPKQNIYQTIYPSSSSSPPLILTHSV